MDKLTQDELILVAALIDYNHNQYDKLHEHFCIRTTTVIDREELIDTTKDIIKGLQSIVHYIEKKED